MMLSIYVAPSGDQKSSSHYKPTRWNILGSGALLAAEQRRRCYRGRRNDRNQSNSHESGTDRGSIADESHACQNISACLIEANIEKSWIMQRIRKNKTGLLVGIEVGEGEAVLDQSLQYKLDI